VHYWADLQLVHGFHCYDNIHVCTLIALYTANVYSAQQEMSASVCTHSMPGFFVSAGDTTMMKAAVHVNSM